MLYNAWKIPLSLSISLCCLAFAQTASIPNVGEQLPANTLPTGYNASAAYQCEDPWKLTLSGDYIYWAWQQEMMSVGTLIKPVAPGSGALLNGTSESIFQTPGYASGFQLGLGCQFKGMDHWLLMAEYTWYHNLDSMDTIPDSREIFAVSPSILRHVQGSDSGVLLSNNFYSSANLHFNNVDLLLQNAFYVSRRLTASFHMGLEGLWISNTNKAIGKDLLFISQDSSTFDVVRGYFTSKQKQKSWALGPKFGMKADWLLGGGVKIIGDVAFSALYTSYINLLSSLTGSISNINIANFTVQQSQNYNTVNPVASASLGMGWGSYLYNHKLHFSISAAYDFYVFWNQNLLGILLDSNASPGNMTLRGFNGQVRFDF